MEACSAAKSAAAEAASNGDWAAAIASYTLALKARKSREPLPWASTPPPARCRA